MNQAWQEFFERFNRRIMGVGYFAECWSFHRVNLTRLNRTYDILLDTRGIISRAG